jgi:hypothetical protein
METGVTFVSVGHRETILRFHDRALRLLVGGGWEIVDAHSIESTAALPLGAASNREPGEAQPVVASLPDALRLATHLASQG